MQRAPDDPRGESGAPVDDGATRALRDALARLATLEPRPVRGELVPVAQDEAGYREPSVRSPPPSLRLVIGSGLSGAETAVPLFAALLAGMLGYVSWWAAGLPMRGIPGLSGFLACCIPVLVVFVWSVIATLPRVLVVDAHELRVKAPPRMPWVPAIVVRRDELARVVVRRSPQFPAAQLVAELAGGKSRVLIAYLARGVEEANVPELVRLHGLHEARR